MQNDGYVSKSANDGCPCLYTTPCGQNCTCVDAFKSGGCLFCCSHGSWEQRREKARRIRRALARAFKPSLRR
jgi:hypothetical protein